MWRLSGLRQHQGPASSMFTFFQPQSRRGVTQSRCGCARVLPIAQIVLVREEQTPMCCVPWLARLPWAPATPSARRGLGDGTQNTPKAARVRALAAGPWGRVRGAEGGRAGPPSGTGHEHPLWCRHHSITSVALSTVSGQGHGSRCCRPDPLVNLRHGSPGPMNPG